MSLTEVMLLITFYRLNQAFRECDEIEIHFKKSNMSAPHIYYYLKCMVK